MIIDFHTHAFPDDLAPRAMQSLITNSNNFFPAYTDGTVNALKENMQQSGIDISVVQPVITKPSQTRTLNEWAQSVQDDKIISFGGVHPDTDDYKRDIDFVCSLGLKGLKFHAEYQNFVVDEPRMLKIYDYAFSKGLIVLHHAGYDPAFKAPFRSSPERFQKVARAMQGGTLVVAHLGGQSQWNDVEKYLVGENVYLDTSMGFWLYEKEQFLRIYQNHGAEKLLFATDTPWSNAKREVELFNALPIPEKDKQLISFGNAKRLLKL